MKPGRRFALLGGAAALAAVYLTYSLVSDDGKRKDELSNSTSTTSNTVDRPNNFARLPPTGTPIQPHDLSALETEISRVLENKSTSAAQKFKFLWTLYQQNRTSAIKGRYLLESMRVLAPSGDVNLIEAELRDSTRAAELTKYLLRLLSAHYVETRSDNAQQVANNEIVLSSVKQYLSNNDPQLVLEATNLLSRIGPVDESISLIVGFAR